MRKNNGVYRRSLGLILLLVGLAIVAGWAGAKYRGVRSCLDTTMAHLRALETLTPDAIAGQDGLAAAGDHLRGAQAGLACLRRETGPFLRLAGALNWVPKVGPDIQAAPGLLEMAQSMADGGVTALDAVSSLLTTRPDLPGAVLGLEQAAPSLASAEAAFAHASAARSRLDAGRLSPRLQRLLTLVDRALPLLRNGTAMARLAPELLGTGGPRTYLILAQNQDERRPTGGWISGVGLVRVDRGRVQVLGFGDSYTVDNLAMPHDPPPESMHRTLWAELWMFRDSNWSPDFPSAARVAADILQRDQGIAVDGTIAVDQEALRRLVAAMEPLSLPDTGQAVTGANLIQIVRQSWTEPIPGLNQQQNPAEWGAHRKDVMAGLVSAMLARVQDQSGSVDPAKLATAAWHALQERHILVYLPDPASYSLLSSGRWDGAILPAAGDYIQVVDANVGFNKLDASVARSIEYQVDLRDAAQIQVEATVHYRNDSPAGAKAAKPCRQQVEPRLTYEQGMAGCFWNYVRFYAPAGSRLVTSTREPLPAGSLLARYEFAPPGDAGPVVEPVEQGKQAFGLFFVVAPGESRDVRLSWALPDGIIRSVSDGLAYHLTVQKQSGTINVPLRVTILLPPGARLVRAAPEPPVTHAAGDAGAVLEGDRIVFDLSLVMDQEIEIVYR